MLAVKNFFLPERTKAPDTPQRFSRMPEAFLRSIRRRSLRVKRAKSLVVPDREKRKSDSFVNSQEWTISRSVPDLRLGIVGSLNSGKSALVHRYLTGSYMQEESPEGGRFKKEVYIDNQSYLLLIRDEGGPPEMQFAAWVDAVIFVFSLENEASFNAVYSYYTKMAHFRNTAEIPIILVGTQDAISDRSPRVIDDTRARKLANDLKRCSYFETCATYGLNVERVFQEACQRIVQHRVSGPPPGITNSRPTTPQGTRLGVASFHHSSPSNGFSTSSPSIIASTGTGSNNSSTLTLPHRHHVLSTSSHHIPTRISADFAHVEQQNQKWGAVSHGQLQSQQQQAAMLAIANDNNNIAKFVPLNQNVMSIHNHQQQSQPQHHQNNQQHHGSENLAPLSLAPSQKDSKDMNGTSGHGKDLPTPTSTPTTSRKSRRRSNLFIPSSKKEDKLKNGEMGSGRSIPLKQGYLYKRSSKSLNKEWKKKYVTLCDDGRLTYHPSLHDYMDDVHGKEIPLQYVTVKVPGQKPRGSKSIITNSALTASMNGKQNGISEGIGCLSLAKDNKKSTEKCLLTAFETLREPLKSNSSQHTSGDEGIAMSNSNSQTFIPSDSNQQQQQQLQQQQQNKIESQTPNVKKRHRRMKSSGVKNNEIDDPDGFEFFIVSLDSKQWHFEAANSEERDEWVAAIEQEIFKSLQNIESSKMKPATSNEVASMVSIRSRVPGNDFCVDCDAANPEWASLNLGILMCIECSGIHRNLGSHISKVRSLDLDDWPLGHLSVMLAIGNNLANSVWEANITRNRKKPTSNSKHEEKEAWIRSKYEAKEFLPMCNQAAPLGQQLVEAVVRSDMKTIILVLAKMSHDQVNSTVSTRDLRTPLHLACATGNLAIAQLLIWNNANIKKTDHEGRTCLAYAKAAASLAIAKSHQNSSSNATISSNASNSSTGSTASAGSSTNNGSGIPAPQYSVDDTSALVDLLKVLGCPESAPLTASGTLPRRRDTLGTPYEKLPSGVM
ncbi:centaurin-gamma-1A [Condylostylus longicornis]|uniref:centaurin-gamma-1A n=1 Tax=Condylostylus longicornis TaxID=2530218 RepID=UPI00244E5559|nr:centaurin-gamma-1A [Condylostylus longicornis]